MKFTKMHGLGNDYVYLLPTQEQDWSALSIAMSDRHFGIGSDGLILALPSTIADFKMRMFNADGSEAEMCGNGIRCVAKFAMEEGLVAGDADVVTVETLAGIKTLQIFRDGGVISGARVDMGAPNLDPGSLPSTVEGPGPAIGIPLTVDGIDLSLTLVSVGNPHAVHYIDYDPDLFPLERIGPQVEHHPMFPRRVNFQVVQVLNPGEVKHRVWERGSGITLASGTSATAVCVASQINGFTGKRIIDHMPGGDLVLEWDGSGSVYMTGPATRVFDGSWLG